MAIGVHAATFVRWIDQRSGTALFRCRKAFAHARGPTGLCDRRVAAFGTRACGRPACRQSRMAWHMAWRRVGECRGSVVGACRLIHRHRQYTRSGGGSVADPALHRRSAALRTRRGRVQVCRIDRDSFHGRGNHWGTLDRGDRCDFMGRFSRALVDMVAGRHDGNHHRHAVDSVVDRYSS